QRPSARDASATPRRAAPAPLPEHAPAARRAGTSVLSGGRGRRPRWAGGAARARRGADHRRRRQGPRLGAHAARPQPRRARPDQLLGPPGRARSGGLVRPVEVNGAPGALYLDGQQRLVAVCALEIAGAQITGISAIVNPDKLAHLGPVGDFTSLLGSAR